MTRTTTRDGGSGSGFAPLSNEDRKDLPRSNRMSAARSVWGSRSADGDDPSMDLGGLDEGLIEIVDEVTRRIMDGEPVDADWLAAHYPDRAAAIRGLLPSMRELAEIGQAKNIGNPVARDDCEPETRKVFGDFRILRMIGRGGMGLVYEAEQISLGRKVALKVIPAAAVMDPRALHRFQLEAQVAGLLQHPRIVPVHASGAVDDVPYYAMQLIEGGSLADLIAEMRDWQDCVRGDNPSTTTPLSGLAAGLLSGRFAPPRRDSESEHSSHDNSLSTSDLSGRAESSSIRGRHYVRTVVRLAIQAAEALAYAHDQGVIHRDIKPANLLLDRRGDLWVADFGMASVQGDAGLTTTGDLPGTLRYMSPEQALGRRALVDRRTDVYSLGVTIYELLTLRPAFAAEDRQEVFRRIVEEEPDSVRRSNPAVPVDLATIVAKAIAKDPASRYETAGQLAADLSRFLDGRPIAARPVGPLARIWRWCRRKPPQAGMAAALMLALIGGFAGIVWNWRDAVRQKRLLVVSQRQAQFSEKKALVHAAKADAINNFLIEKLLRQAAPENNPAAKKVTLLEVLDRAAAEVGTSFRGQPEVEAGIRLAIGKTYHDLGDYPRSAEHYRGAYELYKGQSDETGEGRFKAMAHLGHDLVHIGDLAEAESFLVRAAQESRDALGPTHELYRDATDHLAHFCQQKGRLSDAEALYRRLLEEARHAYGAKNATTVTAMNNLGTLLEKAKKYDEAEQLFRECVSISPEVNGPTHPLTLMSLYNLGFVLKDLGQLDEARTLTRQCLDLRTQVLGPEHPSTLQSLSMLATLMSDREGGVEAERLLRACLEAQRRTLGPSHGDTVASKAQLDALLESKAKPAGAKSP